jgi:hypothetical protein
MALHNVSQNLNLYKHVTLSLSIQNHRNTISFQYQFQYLLSNPLKDFPSLTGKTSFKIVTFHLSSGSVAERPARSLAPLSPCFQLQLKRPRRRLHLIGRRLDYPERQSYRICILQAR